MPFREIAFFGFSQQSTFSWPSATVYFLITDRFVNGDTSNDQNYRRINDYGEERLNAATFHGGDLKGILQKVNEGYFDSLGVNAVWMTDVFEQIHGWQPGSGSAVNDFPLIIRVKPIPNEPIKVAPFFSDGIILVDLYTGQQAKVERGIVKFPSFQNQVAIFGRDK